MMNNILHLSRLWDGSEEGWSLIHHVWEGKDHYTLYNQITQSSPLIEEDEEHEQIVALMFRAGVPILSIEDVRKQRSAAIARANAARKPPRKK